MTSLYIMGFIAITSIAAGLAVYFKYVAPLRKKEKGYDFVYVDDKGNVRELNHAEIEFLERPMMSHEARPVIKRSYEDLNESGTLAGFIQRKRVPQHIVISKKDYGNFNPN